MAAGEGSHISLSFRPIPRLFVRLGWQLKIADFEWNSHFTDVQTHGPFALWQHTHNFAAETRSTAEGTQEGTLLSDDIEYQLPAGPLGALAQPWMQRTWKPSSATATNASPPCSSCQRNQPPNSPLKRRGPPKASPVLKGLPSAATPAPAR